MTTAQPPRKPRLRRLPSRQAVQFLPLELVQSILSAPNPTARRELIHRLISDPRRSLHAIGYQCPRAVAAQIRALDPADVERAIVVFRGIEEPVAHTMLI